MSECSTPAIFGAVLVRSVGGIRLANWREKGVCEHIDEEYVVLAKQDGTT